MGVVNWLPSAVTGVHVVTVGAWLALIAKVTLQSWTLLKFKGDPLQRESLLVRRRGLVAPLWIVAGAALVSGVYLAARDLEPSALLGAYTAASIPKSYAVLLLAKLVALIQMIAGLAWLGSRIGRIELASQPGIQFGIVFVSALSLALCLLVAAITAGLAYLQSVAGAGL